MRFIERETRNLNIKFRKIFVLLKEKHETLSLNLGRFSHWQKQCSGLSEWNLMKRHFCVKLMRYFEKIGTCCDWQYFSLFLKGFENFLNLRLSLTVPLTTVFLFESCLRDCYTVSMLTFSKTLSNTQANVPSLNFIEWARVPIKLGFNQVMRLRG